MESFIFGLKTSLSILLLACSSSVYSNNIINPSNISEEGTMLIGQLRACIDAAIEQGLSTNTQIANYCQQEVGALDNSVPGLSVTMIDNTSK